ncbi:glycosyltransferase family 9 protein [Candidatus Woesearchaeota archaeon]|nr:glycosyltransferase family 9 protein [Candidatus Woesearchaeota archaeon]
MFTKVVCSLGSVFYLLKKGKLPNNIKRVLIFKIGAIGDVLMSTPLVKALDKAGYKVDYCVGNWSKISLESNKRLGKLITFDDKMIFGRKYIQLLKFAKGIRKENYDLIFVLDKSWQTAVLASLFGSFRIGFDRHGEGFANNLNVEYGPVKHDSEYYAELAKFLGMDVNDITIEFFIPKKDKDYAARFFKKNKIGKAVGLVPGGAKNIGVGDEPVRRWPVEKFIELAKRLVKKNYSVILIGGPGDFELNDSIIKTIGSKKIFNVAGPKIGQSAAFMEKCKWIVCNDSGPMHLASGVNKHIIALFGPTNPARKGPVHKESHSIWKDQSIYEEEYETYGRLPKRKDFMKKIKVEDVLRYIK